MAKLFEEGLKKSPDDIVKVLVAIGDVSLKALAWHFGRAFFLSG